MQGEQATLKAYDRDAVVGLVARMSQDSRAVAADPRLGTRDGRKQILAALGVDAATDTKFRLFVYRDDMQELALKGRVDEKGRLVITHSSEVPSGEDVAAVVLAMTKGEFRKLPSPIVLPETAAERPVVGGGDGDPSARVELDQKGQRALMREITILAQAVEASRGLRYSPSDVRGVEESPSKPDFPRGQVRNSPARS